MLLPRHVALLSRVGVGAVGVSSLATAWGHPRRAAAAAALAALTVVGAGCAAVGSDRGATGTAGVAAQQTRPNVLIIVLDDVNPLMAAWDVMPRTRSWLRDGGEEFTRSFATTPLCGPSRASIMTGRYAHNHGVTCNGPKELAVSIDEQPTVQKVLQAHGYRTALIGKYLNRYPLDRNPIGFDRWSVIATGGYTNPMINADGKLRRVPGYSTDLLADAAVRVLRDFDIVDDAAPWLMLLAPACSHKPYTPAARHAGMAVPAWTPGPATKETDLADKPPIVRGLRSDLAAAAQTRALQLNTLRACDELVGRVRNRLDALGETDTLVMLTADNGYLHNQHNIRDTKRFPYEPSVRVPLLLRWPGHVTARSSRPRLVGNIDLAPTVYGATGVPGPAGMDGQSLLGTRERTRIHLEYRQHEGFVDGTALENAVPSWQATRTATTKYVVWADGFREFYDLVTDPYEMVNLLADGNPRNDPDTLPLQAQLDADHRSSAASCPT